MQNQWTNKQQQKIQNVYYLDILTEETAKK